MQNIHTPFSDRPPEINRASQYQKWQAIRSTPDAVCPWPTKSRLGTQLAMQYRVADRPTAGRDHIPAHSNPLPYRGPRYPARACKSRAQSLSAPTAGSNCPQIEQGGNVLAESRRSRPNIHCDIEYRTSYDAYQFVLRMGRDLEMQAAHDAAIHRKRMIVLHEILLNAQRCQRVGIECLGKEAAFVSVNARRDEFDFRDFKRLNPAMPYLLSDIVKLSANKPSASSHRTHLLAIASLKPHFRPRGNISACAYAMRNGDAGKRRSKPRVMAKGDHRGTEHRRLNARRALQAAVTQASQFSGTLHLRDFVA